MKGLLHSRNLEAFQVAAQQLHFGRAADLLCITPSALSQRIATLESQMEQRLFDRGSAILSLTDAGERLLRYCDLTRSLQDELFHDLSGSGGVAGTVTLAGFSSAVRSVLMPVLRDVQLANPALRINFVVADMIELRDLLLRGHADFIVSHDSVGRCGFASQLLGMETNVLIEGTDGHAIRDVYLDHNQTDDFSECFLRHAGLGDASIKRGFFHDIYGILDAVHLGMGRGVVPVHLVSPQHAVRVVPELPTSMPTDVYLQYRERNYLPAGLRLVMMALQHSACAMFARNPANLQFSSAN